MGKVGTTVDYDDTSLNRQSIQIDVRELSRHRGDLPPQPGQVFLVCGHALQRRGCIALVTSAPVPPPVVHELRPNASVVGMLEMPLITLALPLPCSYCNVRRHGVHLPRLVLIDSYHGMGLVHDLDDRACSDELLYLLAFVVAVEAQLHEVVCRWGTFLVRTSHLDAVKFDRPYRGRHAAHESLELLQRFGLRPIDHEELVDIEHQNVVG